MLDVAMKIAVEAYSGKKDKGGNPYILHPLRVMMSFIDEEFRVIALLHDVIEDSNYSLDYLEDNRISNECIRIIDILTRKKYQSYEEYIIKISEDRKASLVKMIDLQDNMSILRLPHIMEEDINRIRKYHNAWNFLYSLHK